jgi:hypothetical protein
MPTIDNGDQPTSSQAMESLDKEELLQLQETLRVAKERADTLLASLGC